MIADPAVPTRPVTDFPFVYLSFDEPFAEAGWADLRSRIPSAVRVHGVAGLDACHKAAADAVAGDWVVTVDADARLLPGFLDSRLPEPLLTGDFRLDWPARNAVNGVWSGNGSVKLWPKRLIRMMRTHEAAPDGSLSLDHEVGDIEPGRSGQVLLPYRVVETDPAQAPGQAFRSGLREAVYLALRARADAVRQGGTAPEATEPGRLLRVWSCVGGHVPNGLFTLYGARLGLLMDEILPGWDLRRVNDYAWMTRFWEERVAPRFRSGRGWRWDWLAADVAALGRRLGLPEVGPDLSRQIADDRRLSPLAPARRLDSLGYRLSRVAAPAPAHAIAQRLLTAARALDHPAAFLNLGQMHARGLVPGADAAQADWLLRAAMALGNPHAPARHQDLLDRYPHLREAEAARPARPASDLGANGPLVLRLDPGIRLSHRAECHVPDPADVPAGQVIGYLCRSEVTGRALPLGIRLMRNGTADGPPDRFRAVVLGDWPAPRSTAAAVRAGARAAAAGGADDGWATLGRDTRFGDAFVIGLLAAALERPAPDIPARAEDREALIRRLAGDLADARGRPVPVWSAAESAAVKALWPEGPEPGHWRAAAGDAAVADVIDAVWGRGPAA